MSGRIAPIPSNFKALVDAWNDPQAFAQELDRYYAQGGCVSKRATR